MGKRLSYTLLTEKYRPEHVKDVLLPTTMLKSFNKMVKEQEIPNLLFHSSRPGTGKSTLARALANDIDTDSLYINTSLERGIDVLRDTIERFASTVSTTGKKKIIILDEFDGTTDALQKALRAAIEQFQNVCRFIIAANFLTQIMSQIQSRCEVYCFEFMEGKDKDQMQNKIAKRLDEIMKAEGIGYDPEVLYDLVVQHYPDIRYMLKLVQQYSRGTQFIDKGVLSLAAINDELYDMIVNKKLTDARKYIIDHSYNYDELYTALFRDMVPKLPKEVQPPVILIIAEYMHRNSQVVDKEINFTACMIEIMGNL